MAGPLRLAVLGTGHMAQTMVAAARHVPGIDVVAIASRDADRARTVAASLAIPRSYAGLAAMLADPTVDALYIANDTAAHAAAAIEALSAGKAVLCEKPLAISIDEAEAIAAAAKRSGRLFIEAVATPFLPAVRIALDKVAAGELGALRHLSASFGYPATPESHPGCWRPDGGGVLLDRAVYPVTLARLALGPIRDVTAQVTRDAAGIDVDAALLLVHENGATSQLTASLTSLLANDMTIAGTAGSINVEAPLLTAERFHARHAATPGRVPPATGLKQRLKENGALRRLRSTVASLKTSQASYGASPYIHELMHFRDLFDAGTTESRVMPPAVSIDVACILQTARESAR